MPIDFIDEVNLYDDTAHHVLLLQFIVSYTNYCCVLFSQWYG